MQPEQRSSGLEKGAYTALRFRERPTSKGRGSSEKNTFTLVCESTDESSDTYRPTGRVNTEEADSLDGSCFNPADEPAPALVKNTTPSIVRKGDRGLGRSNRGRLDRGQSVPIFKVGKSEELDNDIVSMAGSTNNEPKVDEKNSDTKSRDLIMVVEIANVTRRAIRRTHSDVSSADARRRAPRRQKSEGSRVNPRLRGTSTPRQEAKKQTTRSRSLTGRNSRRNDRPKSKERRALNKNQGETRRMLSRAASVSALFSEHKDLIITDDRAHSTLCPIPTN